MKAATAAATAPAGVPRSLLLAVAVGAAGEPARRRLGPGRCCSSLGGSEGGESVSMSRRRGRTRQAPLAEKSVLRVSRRRDTFASRCASRAAAAAEKELLVGEAGDVSSLSARGCMGEGVSATAAGGSSSLLLEGGGCSDAAQRTCEESLQKSGESKRQSW